LRVIYKLLFRIYKVFIKLLSMTTNKYFVTNVRGRFDIEDILSSGTYDPTGGLFTNFPRTSLETYTWDKQINAGNFNYSTSKVDIANNCGQSVVIYVATGGTEVPVKEWATKVAFVLIGAGGGGGGGGWGSNSYDGSGGAGAGSGAVIISKAITLSSYSNILLTTGSAGRGGLGDPISSLADGTNGGDTSITINGITYIAGGGGGGEHGWNSDTSSPRTRADGGIGGGLSVPAGANVNVYETYNGTSAETVSYTSLGSSGSDGGGIDITPTNDYYPKITYSGGDGGAAAGNGGDGAVGTGVGVVGVGGGGGGSSTNRSGTPGGNGANGIRGYAKLIFYP